MRTTAWATYRWPPAHPPAEVVFDQETPRASLWGLLEGIVDRAMGASSAPDLAVALAWKSAGGAGWLDRQTHGLSRFTARHADPWELDARARRVRASSHADSSRLGELGYHPQVAGELFKLKSFVRWAGAGAGAGTAIHAGRCGGHILKGPTILTDGQPLRSCGYVPGPIVATRGRCPGRWQCVH